MLRRSFSRRARPSRRSFITRFGTRRTYRRRPWTTANGQASSPFTHGVPGAYRRIRRTPGRDLPLLARPSRTPAEMKYNPADASEMLSIVAGSSTVVNMLQHGTGVSQRIGNRIQMNRLLIRGRVQPFVLYDESVLSAAAAFNQECDLHVVYDRSPTPTPPAFNDIFDSNEEGAMQRMDNRDRFRILYTKRCIFSLQSIVLPGAVDNGLTIGNGAKAAYLIDVDIPVYLPAVYRDGSDGTSYGDLREGALMIMCMGHGFTDSSFRTHHPAFSGRFRLSYTDV